MFATLSMRAGRWVRALAIMGVSCGAGEALAQRAPVEFRYDQTQLKSIRVNGFELLTGGGGYLIGSPSGADGSGDGFTSYNSDGRRMANNGPAFSLRFTPTADARTLKFRAEVTLDNHSRVATLSLPFDFDKRAVTSWSFAGTQYRFNNEGRTRSGSGGDFASIPMPFRIPAQGPLITYTGFARPATLPAWGQVQGPVASVRIRVTAHSGVREMLFYNHGFTNNAELGFGSLTRGQRVWVEGELTVTPVAEPQIKLESERDFGHQIGRAEADGWSVNVRDRGRAFMSFGPGMVGISGNRQATFLVMFDNVTADNLHILTLEVYDAASNRVLASRQVRRRDLPRAMTYTPIPLAFTAGTNARLEFRTYLANAAAYVRQDGVIVR
jgi:hypothetical protein